MELISKIKNQFTASYNHWSYRHIFGRKSPSIEQAGKRLARIQSQCILDLNGIIQWKTMLKFDKKRSWNHGNIRLLKLSSNYQSILTVWWKGTQLQRKILIKIRCIPSVSFLLMLNILKYFLCLIMTNSSVVILCIYILCFLILNYQFKIKVKP